MKLLICILAISILPCTTPNPPQEIGLMEIDGYPFIVSGLIDDADYFYIRLNSGLFFEPLVNGRIKFEFKGLSELTKVEVSIVGENCYMPRIFFDLYQDKTECGMQYTIDALPDSEASIDPNRDVLDIADPDCKENDSGDDFCFIETIKAIE